MPIPSEILVRLPLLSSLPKVTLDNMAQQATEQVFAKREVVLKKGGYPKALCFLIEGRLQGVDFTSDAREVGIFFIQPGDYFGEVAVIDSAPQPEYVTAVSRSRVVSIPKDLIKPILFASPRLAEALCNSLAARLRQTSAQRRILGLANPLQRVCAQLELMFHLQNGVVRVRNAPTHQELAIMVNASRETVSRVFQLLQGRGVVERDGSDLRVDDPAFVNDVAAGRKDPQK
ncbi:MAG: Crp/Fnr family transcriptional regulator [Betaproteobacteria bacterium]|nr:Crp/Fnr family transcriptional regulator [Betaproteobacteria bacterium]